LGKEKEAWVSTRSSAACAMAALQAITTTAQVRNNTPENGKRGKEAEGEMCNKGCLSGGRQWATRWCAHSI
jgi:hypothetical protein